MPTEKLGHYRIAEKIGAGGMGEVYRARDEDLARDVAIKVLPADSLGDSTARARLLREARSAAALNHPHICTIYEVGEADGKMYIAMELIEGCSLSALIAKGPLSTEQAICYGTQLAEALSHAHDRGIVHRDLKSGNVMVTQDGRIKVLDFGLAKRVSSEAADDANTEVQTATLTRPGSVTGTPAYMAPEQLRGQPGDIRSDIWAMGVVLYEMVAGKRPFHGQTSYELVSAILKESFPQLPPKIQPQLRMAIERCLSKDPARRYARADEIRAALESTGTPAASSWPLRIAAAAIVAAIIAAIGFTVLKDRFSFGLKAPQIQSLAVLPLENLSGDASQEYFADGMTDALITDLGKLHGIGRVIARASVMRFKGSKSSPAEIAQQLHVDALMTGAVVRSGDRVRVSAALVNPATGEQLWADRYERDVQDVLALQNDVSRAIAGAINLKLTPQEEKRLAKVRRVNPATYEAYLRGMSHLQKFTPEEVEKGLQDLNHAVEMDPSDPFAYAGLALGYTMIGGHGPTPMPEAFSRARTAAVKAIELDPNMPEAHAALAAIELYRGWDWEVARRGLERAVALNPSFAQAHRDYAWYLAMVGESDKAIAELKRAKEADPLSSLYTAELGWHYWSVGRQQLALQEARKAVELDPKDWLALMVLSDVCAYNGLSEEGVAAAQKASSVSPIWRLGVALAWAKGSRREEAVKIAAEASRNPKPIYGWGLGQLYAALGNNDEALRWLKFGVDHQFPWMPWIRQNPWYAPLRNDPRFQELVSRMNLPPIVRSTPASASR